jgi:hypothetical protein
MATALESFDSTGLLNCGICGRNVRNVALQNVYRHFRLHKNTQTMC